MGARPAIKIEYRACDGCRICYHLCPMDVFTWDKEINLPRVTYESDCWFEGVCVMECPHRAIDISLPLSNW
ncbi:MAG: ferredoxin family protein [Burkholderiales bacterium]|nr:ferredoxin family protein [Burkholderiales bacterium]